ncbi:MAG: GTPase Era [Gammaproteobacteria bacterium]|nr:MAG: GTPase Era [Gammaproteobacteria bacterium]
MKTGYIALIGRPNVGKSTLLNHLLGYKLSITSRKPQTTRHRILGIKTTDSMQAVFVDTPGIHHGGKRAMNRYMNRTASMSILDVDIIVWVTDIQEWNDNDEVILAKLKDSKTPVILALNKIDKVADKDELLPRVDELAKRFPFKEIIPLSALKSDNLERLESLIYELLPEGIPFYPEDQVTDRTERFLASEIVREKLFRKLGQELPHAITVEIESYEDSEKLVRIQAIIWVERDGQKTIVIGEKGKVLKTIGQRARIDIEQLVGKKVYLGLWVKVKKGWSDNERALQSLGYLDR